METPIPIEINETIFLNINLIFNSNNYNIDFYDMNNEIIKIIAFSNNSNKYIFTSYFKDFKRLNKYFKMFDTLKELEDDLIGLNKLKKIEIIEITETALDLCINVLTFENNKVIITLKKEGINDKEKINIILKENEEIKKEIKEQNSRIIILEKEINELKIEIINLKNKMQLSNNIIMNNIYDFVSDVFFNVEEKKLVVNEISKHITSIKLLFSSKIYGADADKLIGAYLNRPNLLFLIMTKKGKDSEVMLLKHLRINFLIKKI